MDSKLLVGLIKEVVKSEVKQQVKEELAKLIKSGAVTLNKERKQPSLMEMTEVQAPVVRKQQPIQQKPQQMKEYTSNPMLNEVLNMTTPFTAKERAEGGMPGMEGGSVLDMLQPQRTMEEDWETMDYRMDQQIPQNMPNFQSTGDDLQDATIKALTRDYSQLVKRFK